MIWYLESNYLNLCIDINNKGYDKDIRINPSRIRNGSFKA